jgi:hypothetical protein
LTDSRYSICRYAASVFFAYFWRFGINRKRNRFPPFVTRETKLSFENFESLVPEKTIFPLRHALAFRFATALAGFFFPTFISECGLGGWRINCDMIRFAASNGSGDLGMSDNPDTWPLPTYNPGSTKHLHALGVIAVCYAAFQAGMDTLYKFHLEKQKVPERLINLHYFSLNEEKRISALKAVFEEWEKEPALLEVVHNLAEYFYWCKNCRDQLLHAEQYPPLFGGTPDHLYLSKRIGKENPSQGYMAFSLRTIRGIADKIQAGRLQCAKVRIYIRFRDRQVSKTTFANRFDLHEPLPEILRVPKLLKLSPTPPTPPLPSYLRES